LWGEVEDGDWGGGVIYFGGWAEEEGAHGAVGAFAGEACAEVRRGGGGCEVGAEIGGGACGGDG
jgi:hypothetical protein